MNIETITSNNETAIQVFGRVDTNTAPQLQTAVLDAFKLTDTVTLDCKELAYISSAGLRVLLIGEKTAKSKGGCFILMNVSKDVMSTLNLVGFSAILTIR